VAIHDTVGRDGGAGRGEVIELPGDAVEIGGKDLVANLIAEVDSGGDGAVDVGFDIGVGDAVRSPVDLAAAGIDGPVYGASNDGDAVLVDKARGDDVKVGPRDADIAIAEDGKDVGR
jgi:hypothetical protein